MHYLKCLVRIKPKNCRIGLQNSQYCWIAYYPDQLSLFFPYIAHPIISQDEKVYEKLFRQTVDLFHPYDSDFLELLHIYYTKKEDVDFKSLDIMRLILLNYHQNLPKNDLKTGVNEMEFANLCHILGFHRKAKEHIEKARNILKIRLGVDHSLYLEEWSQIHEEIMNSK